MTIPAPDLSWPSTTAPERELLEGFLDGYRAVLLRKAAGLDRPQLATRLAPSALSLGGLVKHMAAVEDGWFTECFSGDELPEPWAGVDIEADPDWDFRTADADTPETLLGWFEAACSRSRAVAAGAGSLDAESARRSNSGAPFTLRWIYVHMIEEYARHAGHADLIRESIDGSTGD